VSKLPVLSGAQCVKALGKIGFEFYRQRGSHIVRGLQVPPPAQTTIPYHKELDGGTLRAIIRHTGLTVEEFIALL
jgi:predicted RNA binding protein YcfA (HicA-like mRNA interferase family)